MSYDVVDVRPLDGEGPGRIDGDEALEWFVVGAPLDGKSESPSWG